MQKLKHLADEINQAGLEALNADASPNQAWHQYNRSDLSKLRGKPKRARRTYVTPSHRR